MRDLAGFIDVGYLRAEGGRALGLRLPAVRPEAAGVVAWLQGRQEVDGDLLRAYWYDGAFDTRHERHDGQRRFLDAIAATPGVQLRLGHIAERQPKFQKPIRAAVRHAAEEVGADPDALLAAFDRNWTFRPEQQQKGVDTLIALDLVRLAGRGVYSTAVVLSGDRDLAEAVRAAQDLGARVVVATPDRRSVARELAQLADEIVDLAPEELRTMISTRPVGDTSSEKAP